MWIQRAQEEHVAVAENINKVLLACEDRVGKTNCRIRPGSGRTQCYITKHITKMCEVENESNEDRHTFMANY